MAVKNREQVVEDYLNDLLQEGDSTPCDIGNPENIRLEVPEWYDEQKFKRGQQFCRDNLFAMVLVQFCGLLMMGGACPKLVRILEFTKNSSTPCTAYRRYSSTFLHTLTWYNEDLSPHSKSWESIRKIRKRHLFYSGLTKKHGLGFFTQKDMVDTQFAIMSFALTRPKYLGIHNTNKQDLEAFIHFWRTIGYMFGIKDRFNLCRNNLEDTQAICITYLETFIRNNYSVNDSMAIKMQNAFIQGIKAAFLGLHSERFIYFTRRLIGLKGYGCYSVHQKVKMVLNQDKCQYETCEFSKLPMVSQLNLIFASFLLERLFKFIIVKLFFNSILKMSVVFIKYFPIIAIVKFGKKEAFLKQ